MLWISALIALIALIIGSITDLKKREVHDYVSYGLIIISFGVSIIYSIVLWDYHPMLHATLGFIIGLVIAYAMFYLGQWGGGDSKLIMGLGAVIGFNAFPIFGENNYWLFMFLINMLFIGAMYGMIWSVYLAIKHRRIFLKNVNEWLRRKDIKILRILLLASTLIALALIILLAPEEFKILLISFVAMIFMIFYVWIFIKVIEQSCMIKELPISKLTEGDWIFKDIIINKKVIAGPKDLGISKEQIALLKKFAKQKKIKKVLVKEGIPFIPAFLIAFIITLIMAYAKINILGFLQYIIT
jgi:Flp pilus assembly protein protease CpaA